MMQIHLAARSGDREEVQRQLAQDVSIDAREEEGKTPLMLAADSPDADAAFLGFLLDQGADLAARDRWNMTPWLHAVCSGDLGKARLLMERSADIQAAGRGGDTALTYAAEDDAPMTEWLLSLGFDVNSADEYGATALHTAARCSAVHVIPILLAAGADIFASDHVQTQPIDEASTIETVRLLLEAGADINYVNGQGYWLLLSAVQENDVNFAGALLDAGADPNMQDGDGSGLLWFARSVEAVELLLQAGVNVHHTNNMGQEALAWHTNIEIQARLIAAGCDLNPPGGAPLMSAVERGDLRQVQFLLNAGAIADAGPGWGQTPLMEAAENSFADGVRLLLSAGADVSLQDLLSAGAFAALQERGGRTALHHAAAPEAFTAYTLAQDVIAKYGTEPGSWIHIGTYGYVESDSVECLNLLAEAGADINAADAAGFTPLLLAAACGRASRVANLLALGADSRSRTADGKSVLELAEAHPREDQREQILRVLETYGPA